MHNEASKISHPVLESPMGSAVERSSADSTALKSTTHSPALNSLSKESALLEQSSFDDDAAVSRFGDIIAIDFITGKYAMLDDSLDVSLPGLPLDISLAKYVSYE